MPAVGIVWGRNQAGGFGKPGDCGCELRVRLAETRRFQVGGLLRLSESGGGVGWGVLTYGAERCGMRGSLVSWVWD